MYIEKNKLFCDSLLLDKTTFSRGCSKNPHQIHIVILSEAKNLFSSFQAKKSKKRSFGLRP
jgi:hypothetical protein